MSFTDEALKAKLSTLNETQDSIVSVSQWIMFHKYVLSPHWFQAGRQSWGRLFLCLPCLRVIL